MTIADTCFLIDLMKGDPGAVTAARNDGTIRTTAISSAEFLYGIRRTGRKDAFDNARKFLGFFRILPFQSEDAIIYADIAARLAASGSRISTLDEMIAAVAIRHGEAVLTRDNHFRNIDGLDLIRY